MNTNEERALKLYVSPEGNDAWSGRYPEPNRQRTDGPFASLDAAQKAVRALRAKCPLTESVRIILRGGLYCLRQPLRLGPDDSGIPEEATGGSRHSISYEAYKNETPVLSAGRRITNWRIEKLHGKTVWTTTLPDVKHGKWYFTQLWVNGKRRYRPQLPRKGEYQIATVLDACFEGDWSRTVRKGAKRFGFASGEISADWRNLQDVELMFLTLWVCVRAKIRSVDMHRRIVTMDRNSAIRLTNDFGRDGAAYVVENVFEALEKPGQWYLDRRAGKLYYLPLPGERPAKTEVIAPVLTAVLQIEGQPKNGRKVASVRFAGITFAHNEWTPPKAYAMSEQASRHVPGAVTLRHVRNCDFQDCNFAHLGTYAVEMSEDCADIRILRSSIHDLGAGGVKIWHGCRRNTVADCNIYDGGIIYPSGVGVLIGKSSGNIVGHNHIHDFYYTGISVGWTWGYAESEAYGNIVEWNHIHDIGKGKLSDMGGIYTLGVSPGTRLRYNVIHDVIGRTYGGFGIYPDEGSSDILIENNVCYRTKSAGFHQHFGRNNVVQNNIFALGREQQIALTRIEPHRSFVFKNNIVYYAAKNVNGGPYGNHDWPVAKAVFEKNLYWCTQGPVMFTRQGSWSCLRSFPNGFAQAVSCCDTVIVHPGLPGPGKIRQPTSRALGIVPAIAGTCRKLPVETDWAKGLRLPGFVAADGIALTEENTDTWLLQDDKYLYVRMICHRLSGEHQEKALPLWSKEHAELFLRPSVSGRSFLQFGLSVDGETEMVIHGPARLAGKVIWHGHAEDKKDVKTWIAMFRILKDSVSAACGENTPAWGILVGRKTSGGNNIDFRKWQEGGWDTGSFVADPSFINPAKGDFRLKKNSPAYKIGFVPWTISQAGQIK